MSKESLYKVQFHNKGEFYEIYAKNIFQSDIFGFIGIENVVFGSQSSIVVDPSEEKLKSEFEGVKKSYIPMHSIIRIDEVEKPGKAKISDATNKVMPFPNNSYSTPIKQD
ncbi:MAG: DUF1820 family protein [Gammaproteobacteria bacterium]|nr:DUF1820 family protein [Gammaproteobacteria bacterium]